MLGITGEQQAWPRGIAGAVREAQIQPAVFAGDALDQHLGQLCITGVLSIRQPEGQRTDRQHSHGDEHRAERSECRGPLGVLGSQFADVLQMAGELGTL